VTIQALRQHVERQKGKRDHLQRDESRLSKAVRKADRHLGHIAKGRVLLQEVAQQTQEQLRFHIEEIVSLALDAVFPDPYRLEVSFEQRRGKTECDLWFVGDGGDERIRPIDAAGGGAVDVAAFALRVALFSLQRPKSRAVLALDEPGRFVSRDLQGRFGEMVAEISHRLGIQIIMVTHSEEYVEAADRVFRVSQRKGVSKVVAGHIVHQAIKTSDVEDIWKGDE
jgi:chromosome segregation ATPase